MFVSVVSQEIDCNGLKFVEDNYRTAFRIRSFLRILQFSFK